LTDLEIIIPRPGEVRPDKPYRTPDQRWEEVTKNMYGSAELPTNIWFDHDPNWDGRFWSIQNAHDQFDLKVFGFWTIVGLLMVTADLAWYFVRAF
jgi:hypothetical protein